MKKNILILNYEFPPLGGGAANATKELLCQFSGDEKLEIVLVTSSTGGFRKEHFAKNIVIYFLDIGKQGKNLQHQSIKDLLVYSLKSYWFVRKLMRQQGFDLVHAFFGVPCGVVAALVTWVSKIPYVVSLRGSDVPGYSKKYKILDLLCFGWLSKLVWNKAAAVCANSQGLQKLALNTSSHQKISVIPNGVDLPSQSHSLAKDTSQFTILYVGRLIERKGVAELLSAFSLFSKGKSDVRLRVVGGGKDYDMLKASVHKHQPIIFYGEQKHSSVRKFYQQSDLYVLPSKNEGMSNTLLEAMASKLPIIVTPVGGTQELFCDNGWIVEAGNVDELCAALESAYLLWQQNQLAPLGEKSQKKVHSLSWSSIADQYRGWYRGI